MTLIAPLALLAAAMAALYFTPPETLLFGLDHPTFARVAIGGALVMWMLLSGARRRPGRC
jgi:hypothetical protein